jgi:Icc-related predicted phosphoesterase
MVAVKRLLIVSDIHGSLSNVEKLGRISRDVTIVAGDLAECGSREEAEQVLAILEEQGAPVVWVPGNCDDPSLASLGAGLNVHARSIELEGVVYAGAGGSLYTPFNTPFEYGEEELAKLLENALQDVEDGKPLILVVHTPPYGSGLDRVSSGDYVGSKVLVEYIARYKPLLVATGHIHEAWGAASVAGSLAVNPGPLAAGRYAVVEIDTSTGAARARTFRL